MRPYEATQHPVIPATLAAPTSGVISGVCSACGTTYSIPCEEEGHTELCCPRCGPSMPIEVKDAVPTPRRRSRLRSVLPRIPFVVVQLMVILLTFGIFMGFVLKYMNGKSPAARKLAKQAVAADGPAAADATNQASTSTQDANEGTKDDATPDTDTVAVPSADVASGNADRTDDQPDAEAESPETLAAEHVVAARTPSEVSAAIAAAIDIEPLPSADDSLTLREIQFRRSRLFEQEFLLQCRVLQIFDDAVGKVPNSFYVGNRKVDLNASQEADYLRMEVMDCRGETMDSVFVSTQGTVGNELQWTMPGDWVLVTATVGMRYDSTISDLGYGLILTKISALQENTVNTREPDAKKIAER